MRALRKLHGRGKADAGLPRRGDGCEAAVLKTEG